MSCAITGERISFVEAVSRVNDQQEEERDITIIGDQNQNRQRGKGLDGQDPQGIWQDTSRSKCDEPRSDKAVGWRTNTTGPLHMAL
ncbi:hypothetical protein N7475_001784 [Penicillium sp. IBT 31633x]|nr:hypothetical protein N7475_001784 [Penicillium sp. IBT 31633x]